jgi:hypothetical protein
MLKGEEGKAFTKLYTNGTGRRRGDNVSVGSGTLQRISAVHTWCTRSQRSGTGDAWRASGGA